MSVDTEDITADYDEAARVGMVAAYWARRAARRARHRLARTATAPSPSSNANANRLVRALRAGAASAPATPSR